MASYALCPHKMLCFCQNLVVLTWGYHTGLDEWHVILVMMETGWGGLTWRTHCSKLSSSVLSSERGFHRLGRAACLFLSAPTLLCRWGFSGIHDTSCIPPSSRISGPAEGRPAALLACVFPGTAPSLRPPQVWPLTPQVPCASCGGQLVTQHLETELKRLWRRLRWSPRLTMYLKHNRQRPVPSNFLANSVYLVLWESES